MGKIFAAGLLLCGLLAQAGCAQAPVSQLIPTSSQVTTSESTRNATLTASATLPADPPTPEPSNTTIPTLTSTITPTPTPREVRFAVIGDYGSGDEAEQRVADLVLSWDPDLVLTVGDNNYPLGEVATIDDHIGRFYHGFIYPYTGSYGVGADFQPLLSRAGQPRSLLRAGQGVFRLLCTAGQRALLRIRLGAGAFLLPELHG